MVPSTQLALVRNDVRQKKMRRRRHSSESSSIAHCFQVLFYMLGENPTPHTRKVTAANIRRLISYFQASSYTRTDPASKHGRLFDNSHQATSNQTKPNASIGSATRWHTYRDSLLHKTTVYSISQSQTKSGCRYLYTQSRSDASRPHFQRNQHVRFRVQRLHCCSKYLDAQTGYFFTFASILAWKERACCASTSSPCTLTWKERACCVSTSSMHLDVQRGCCFTSSCILT